MQKSVVVWLSFLISGAVPAVAQTDWPTYGHDKGGLRHSPLNEITPENVANLKVAWVYHLKPASAPAIMPQDGPGGARRREATGLPPGTTPRNPPQDAATAQAIAEGVVPQRRPGRFLATEVTPIVADGLMYLSSPYKEIIALDPASGKEVWKFKTPGTGLPSLRGVEFWPGDPTHPAEILSGTRDGKLIALEAKTGRPITGFGVNGIVDMRTPEVMNGSDGSSMGGGYGMTSPPIVYKNLVITGSATPEMPADGPAGDVRAWDVLTGKLVWTFHSVPRPGEKGHETWLDNGWKNRTGVNVWGFLTVDAARGIVYMPFGAPSWDRYGGDRKGNGLFGTSLVAADANTGKLLWYFQAIHHDIWDYDLEAPPILLDVKHGKDIIPAVVIVSKSSQTFFLNRVTGKPIYPIEERAVPKSDVPGEVASPTQPFATVTPPISKSDFTMADIATVTPELESYCRNLVTKNNIAYGPVFTPVPYQRTIISFPSTQGGVNWGGASFDPQLGLMYVNVLDLAQLESIVPTPDRPLPYGIGPVGGRFWQEDKKLPCQQPPWGELEAINVNTGKMAWRVPLGVTDSFPADKQKTGRPNIGGSITTAGGLVFVGATDDSRFRAFDAKTGAELWTVMLGAAAHATPATYLANGKQYVVIASAGGTFLNDPISDDSVTAFALSK